MAYNLHLLLKEKRKGLHFLFSLETRATILELIYFLFIPENQAMHSGNEISTEFFSREARKSMFRAALDSCNLRFNGNHFLIQPVILLTPILPKVCTQNNFLILSIFWALDYQLDIFSTNRCHSLSSMHLSLLLLFAVPADLWEKSLHFFYGSREWLFLLGVVILNLC